MSATRRKSPVDPAFGREAAEKLREIALDPDTTEKTRVEIWKWFGEMAYGKPRRQPDDEPGVKPERAAPVRFEGVLEQWSL